MLDARARGSPPIPDTRPFLLLVSIALAGAAGTLARYGVATLAVRAALYVAGSVGLSLLAIFLGFAVARMVR